MDPNVTLEEIRDIVGLDEDSPLAELIISLDDWLTKGGFLPLEWERARNPSEEA